MSSEHQPTTSLRTALRDTLQHQSWVVKQVSFIVVTRSLNEQVLQLLQGSGDRNRIGETHSLPIHTDTLGSEFVSTSIIFQIRWKLTMKIYDEYANILRGMYNVGFNGSCGQVISTQVQSTPSNTTPPFFNTLTSEKN